jgi:hypothetical protein
MNSVYYFAQFWDGERLGIDDNNVLDGCSMFDLHALDLESFLSQLSWGPRSVFIRTKAVKEFSPFDTGLRSY